MRHRGHQSALLWIYPATWLNEATMLLSDRDFLGHATVIPKLADVYP